MVCQNKITYLLLVGINNDKEKKTHECKIEKWSDLS